MKMLDKGSMDLVLVPCGLAIMLSYHILLLYRILRHPHTTVIGYENHHKLAWIQRMLQATPVQTSLALSVMSDNISASTTLASLCIALGSLIGAWVSSDEALMAGTGAVVFYGDASQSTASIKFTSLLVCFLASFACFIQSTGHYVHASFLMSAPGSDMPASHVQRAMIRGGNFWAAGLRSLYLATMLLMWIFGPVPMLVCSVLTVAVLHLLDTNSMPLHHHRFTARPNPELHSPVYSPAYRRISGDDGEDFSCMIL